MRNMWNKTRDMNFIKVCLSGKTPKDNALANSKGGPRAANDKWLHPCLCKDFRSLATIH